MQQLKPLPELLQPDATNLVFGGISPVAVTLENIHAMVSGICLRESVPEDVRDYMESIKNLAVFGWFHYPFYTHAMFLATTALEMALRARFPVTGEDRRAMGRLLKEAQKAGLQCNEHQWRTMVYLRNKFVHREQSTIMTPWMATDFLSLAAEMINALFAVADAQKS